MSSVLKCPNCGSVELILLNKDTNEYKCKACLKTCTLGSRQSGVSTGNLPVNEHKRKMFFDNLMKTAVELRCYFDEDVVSGTGFFVSSEYLLTNAHVIFKNVSNRVNLSDLAIQIVGNNYDKNNQYIFEFISADTKKDIALLKLQEGSVKNIVKFTQNIYNGEQVFAIGNSRGEGLCIVEGLISDVKRVHDDNTYFMTSAIVTNGNSGCPVFDTQGLLIGMITEGSKQSVAMNYAIPSAVLIEFIENTEQNEQLKIL